MPHDGTPPAAALCLGFEIPPGSAQDRREGGVSRRALAVAADFPVQPRFTFVQLDGPGFIPDVTIDVFDFRVLGVPYLEDIEVPWFTCSPDFAPGGDLDAMRQPCCTGTCLKTIPPSSTRICTIPPVCGNQCP